MRPAGKIPCLAHGPGQGELRLLQTSGQDRGRVLKRLTEPLPIGLEKSIGCGFLQPLIVSAIGGQHRLQADRARIQARSDARARIILKAHRARARSRGASFLSAFSADLTLSPAHMSAPFPSPYGEGKGAF